MNAFYKLLSCNHGNNDMVIRANKKNTEFDDNEMELQTYSVAVALI